MANLVRRAFVNNRGKFLANAMVHSFIHVAAGWAAVKKWSVSGTFRWVWFQSLGF